MNEVRLAVALLAALGVACSGRAGCKPSAPAHERDGGTAVIARALTLEQAKQELWPVVRGVAYQPATVEEKRALAALIDALWRGADERDGARLAPLARDAGMALEAWTVDGARVWVVREPSNARRGGGIYVVRVGTGAAPLLWQAPHVYFDRFTQSLAADAFFAARTGRGLFSNSLHRYQQSADVKERRIDNPADVAHNPDHLFQVATQAVIAVGPATIVQLHGFDGDSGDKGGGGDAEDDDASRAGGADAIVSAGRKDGSTAASTAVAHAIADALHVVVARFPEDTRGLGGTSNVQGRLVDGVAGAGFVHVEMTLELRKALARDGARTAAMGRAIADALAGSAR